MPVASDRPSEIADNSNSAPNGGAETSDAASSPIADASFDVSKRNPSTVAQTVDRSARALPEGSDFTCTVLADGVSSVKPTSSGNGSSPDTDAPPIILETGVPAANNVPTEMADNSTNAPNDNSELSEAASSSIADTSSAVSNRNSSTAPQTVDRNARPLAERSDVGALNSTFIPNNNEVLADVVSSVKPTNSGNGSNPYTDNPPIILGTGVPAPSKGTGTNAGAPGPAPSPVAGVLPVVSNLAEHLILVLLMRYLELWQIFLLTSPSVIQVFLLE